MLRKLAAEAGVDFQTLLELAANNSWEALRTAGSYGEEFGDLLDDHLFALHTDPLVNPDGQEPAHWVETVFRGSLAAIQARLGTASITTVPADEVLQFLRTRAENVLQRLVG